MSFMIINAVLLAGMLIMCLIVVLLPFWRIVPVYGAYYYFNLTAVVAAPLYWLLIAPLALGVCAFMIDTFRGRYASYVRLFSGYKAFFKTLGLMLVIYFRVFAWSLLFIIPGFVAIFRYSMGALCPGGSSRLENNGLHQREQAADEGQQGQAL